MQRPEHTLLPLKESFVPWSQALIKSDGNKAVRGDSWNLLEGSVGGRNTLVTFWLMAVIS